MPSGSGAAVGKMKYALWSYVSDLYYYDRFGGWPSGDGGDDDGEVPDEPEWLGEWFESGRYA